MTFQHNFGHERRARFPAIVPAMALAALLAFPVFAQNNSADAVQGPRTNSLSGKLAWIREELALAQVDVNKCASEYSRLEHDIVFSNKALYKLFTEVKSLEKEILEKRTALQEETMKSPEMRKAIKDRMEAYANRSKLMEQEAFYLKELKREEKSAAPPVESAGK